jgi:tRNA(fMet)-specific endonuclease VapC
MYLLDTDHLSLLEYDSADSLTLQMRMDRVASEEIATTIITYEEQMRGWLARVAAANTTEKMRIAYGRLQAHITTFAGIPILPFDDSAIAIYERLRQSKVRIGTMDLKIAAIALANDAILLTRNRSDFEKVHDLRFEDWSS